MTAGSHTVLITSQTNNALYLDYFLVPAIGSTPSELGLAPAGSATNMSTNTSSSSKSSASLPAGGMIVGGVIGGLSALALIMGVLGYLLWGRRKRHNKHPGTLLPQSWGPPLSKLNLSSDNVRKHFVQYDDR